MARHDADTPVRPADGLNRRAFLHAGAGSLATLGMGRRPPGPGTVRLSRDRRGDVSCIFLVLVGGPSHLDTWDMKPDAPDTIRGPFRPIATRVPGILVSEIFPRLAGRTDRVAFVRSVHHEAAAVHDTGLQLLQTGRLCAGGVEHPHYGSVLSSLVGPSGNLPTSVVLPGPIEPTGGNMPHGQSAGYLGRAHDPRIVESEAATGQVGAMREAIDLDGEPSALRGRYGQTRFGRSCLRARRLVERGVRFVTVNMYQRVFSQKGWDAHGSSPFSSPSSYRYGAGPTFDLAYSGLLDDLDSRGLLETTMVVAVGEFGRTPRINQSGGRDHHPGCWTALFAGGPVQGGRVVGASDETGATPTDRPVSPAEVAATVYNALGVRPDTLLPGPDGRPIRLVDEGVGPIGELF